MIKRVLSCTGAGLEQLLGFEANVNKPAAHALWATSHHGPHPESSCALNLLR